MSSQGSIPNHRPGPILSGPRKLVLASLVAIPMGAYVFLRTRQANSQRQARQLEEEGRRNWTTAAATQENNKDRNYHVNVGRSGGGI